MSSPDKKGAASKISITVTPKEQPTEAPYSITSQHAEKKRREHLSRWLKSSDFDLAITISLQRNINGFAPSLSGAQKTFRRICIDLEKWILGNQTRRKGARLIRATFISLGKQDDHPHAHIALLAPTFMQMDDFYKKVTSYLRHERLVGTFKVKRIYSEGWIDYMTHHGLETFEPELSCLAMPLKG